MIERQLSTSDLRLLGNYYSTGFGLVVEDDGRNVQLVPPRSTWVSLTLMALVISVFYVGFIYFAYTMKLGDELGPAIWLVYVAIGLLAIAGPVVGHKLQLAYSRRLSPLLDFDRSGNTLSLLAGSQIFDADAVFCLLGLCMRASHGDAMSELQVVVCDDDGLRPILIATDLSSFPRRSFGDTMRQFRDQTGIRAVIAEPEGLLRGGEMKIYDLD